MNTGNQNHTFDGAAAKRPPQQQQTPQEELPKQCGWCWVRMTGPLAGWKANRPLPDYSQWICAACQAQWAAMSDAERKAWAKERQQRDAQQQQQR